MSAPRFFCRDCLSDHDAPQRNGAPTRLSRCPSCSSPRLLSHPERDDLSIAHVDCDAFYASVEKRDNPEIRDKPVIVGGGKRGVVSTCCYIARIRGVRSAMPMFKALDLCPEAVVIKPNMTKYAEVGRQIRGLMLDLTPLVEPLSIDEAFLDLTGTALLHHASPALTLARFAHRVEKEIGVSVSVGLSYCKFLAKFASDLDKPRGFAVIGRAEAVSLLAPRPVGQLWGVGAVARERLEKDGFHTIGDIQAREETDLMKLYGAEGQRLWRLSRGVDNRRVEPEQDAKSVSNETTFESDVSDLATLQRVLFSLSEKVSGRLKKEEIAGKVVTLKLKTPDFKLRTRQRIVPATQLAGRIYAVARELLEKEADGAKFRLIGVGVSDLVAQDDADRGDLLDATVAKEKATERAIDALRDKFGKSIVAKGLNFTPKRNEPDEA